MFCFYFYFCFCFVVYLHSPTYRTYLNDMNCSYDNNRVIPASLPSLPPSLPIAIESYSIRIVICGVTD